MASGQRGSDRAAPARVVQEHEAEEHRQTGHYPWKADCGVCNDAALRSAQHRRQLPHAGRLAVDLVGLTRSGPHVLVGVTQVPGHTCAEAVKSRAAADLRAPPVADGGQCKGQGRLERGSL